MATIWLTYAWADNETADVDFAIQELEEVGLEVKRDRWNLQSGIPLWVQIEEFIQSPELSDAWGLYATQSSLGSKACQEEYHYALDRALNKRGDDFPVIGIFPGPVDSSLIPAGIRTRLYVSLTDPDWKERIKAAAERRAPSITREAIKPFSIQVHSVTPESEASYAIEVRPRAGTWTPFFAAVPIGEKDNLKKIQRGPRSTPPSTHTYLSFEEAASADGDWWIMFNNEECTPTQSYYIYCDKLPSKVKFSVLNNGQLQYEVPISEN